MSFHGGGRETSSGKVHGTSMRIRRLYAHPPTDTGLRCREPAYPRVHASISASLTFDSASHLRLPPDAPSRLRPCHIGVRFPPSGSSEDLVLFHSRDFTSCSVSMPLALSAPLRSALDFVEIHPTGSTGFRPFDLPGFRHRTRSRQSSRKCHWSRKGPREHLVLAPNGPRLSYCIN